jgi:hypothetical protein
VRPDTIPVRGEQGERVSRRVVWSSRVGVWLVRLLGRTWRFRVSHDDDVRRLRAQRAPFVFSLWHGQLLPLLYYHRGQGVTVLISEHSDGEIIARIATSFGFQTVRGSTSRGAARALLTLTRVLTDGGELAITPDGPRGPAKSLAPGVGIIAERAGVPVVAAAASSSASWRLGTWDRFLIPRPFARIHIAYSDAVAIGARGARCAGDGAGARGDAWEDERVRAAMDAAEQRAGG